MLIKKLKIYPALPSFMHSYFSLHNLYCKRVQKLSKIIQINGDEPLYLIFCDICTAKKKKKKTKQK